MASIDTVLITCSCFLFALSIFARVYYKQRTRRPHPPGPPGWPLFGNMFDLGTMPLHTMYNLKFKYGPVLWLKLGAMNTMVIQSAKAADELFKNHDASFCDRKVTDALSCHDFNRRSMAVGLYSPYWRMLRRLCSMALFTNKRINETASVRRKCVNQMLKYIEEDVEAAQARGESGELNLVHYLFLSSFNVVGNLMLSRDLLDPQCKEGHEFFAAMDRLLVIAGTPNIADFLPFLKRWDPQGAKKNATRVMGQAMDIVAEFVKERVNDQKSGKVKMNDLLDALLEYEGDGKEGPYKKLPYENVITTILEMFIAGSETTSTVMEWGMAELLRQPNIMKRLQDELDQVVGRGRKVDESDIEKLPYLQAVIKETLRLHPPIPLLIPRNTVEDTSFMGYFIPKDTQVLVSAWAIGRESECWADPLTFKPERFLGSNLDYKGHNFEFIPFGSGRRICVGISLAQRVVHLGLASIVHSFDWEISANSATESLDMTERMGITVRKLTPLKVIPKKRLSC